LKTSADQLMAISRPRGVARWMALGLLAGALGGCSTVSSWFSSDSKPKPKELGPNPGLLAVHQAWTAKLGAEVPLASDIHVQGDTLLIAAKDGSVTALDARNGSQLSRFTVGEPLTTGVGGDAQRQAVLTRSNQVIVFEQGKQLWKQPLPAAAYTPPLLAGGRVFVLAADRSLAAFDAANGRKLWTSQRPGEPLVLRQPGVLMAVGNTLVAGLSGRMVGIDPDTGAVRWEAPLASPRGTNDVERLVDLVAASAVSATASARAPSRPAWAAWIRKTRRCAGPSRPRAPTASMAMPIPCSVPKATAPCRPGAAATARAYGPSTSCSTAA
jgi:hypothetical protein